MLPGGQLLPRGPGDGRMLPDIEMLRQAIQAYAALAYGQRLPPRVRRLMPPPQTPPQEWLMGDLVQRDPPDAPMDQVVSFIVRLGNRRYPHMKLRLTRPSGYAGYVLSVDAHDAFLHAPAGSPDEAALEDLKRFNARLSQDVMAEWDRLGLPTERSYMRELIERKKRKIKKSQIRNSKSQTNPNGD